MKLTELIHDLILQYLEHGDLTVYCRYGCGCCEWYSDPEPRYQPTRDYSYEGPVGLHLN